MPFYARTSFFHLQAYSDCTPDFPGPVLPEQEKKKGRNKRAPKGGEKPASRYKKRKKEGDERQLMHSGHDTVMTQIKQVKLILWPYNLLLNVLKLHRCISLGTKDGRTIIT